MVFRKRYLATAAVCVIGLALSTWFWRVLEDQQLKAQQASDLPLLVLIGSITTVLLLTAYLATIVGRTARIERTVARRTRELEQQVAFRERAEKTVRASEAQLRAVLESTPDGVITCDSSGKVSYFNPGAERMFGVTKGQAVGKPFTDLLPIGVDRPDGLKGFLSAEAVEVIGRTIELTAKRRDGSEFPVSLSLTSWRDSEGSTWFTAIVRDISTHQQAENQLMQTASKLERSRSQLRSAKDVVEKANRAKSEFLANMSHEIRTPMNGIIGMTQLLLQSELTPEQHSQLRLVKHSADALLRLLNDILDFSKIEAGRLEVEAIPFHLRDCLGDTVKTFGMLASEKGLELVCRIPSTVPDALIGDPGRLRQIVVNLAGNSIKFTERGEVAVTVNVEARNDQEVVLHFSVRDTGIGILPEKQRTIFQAFNQADSSMSRRFGGTGLGLAISAQLVRMMNGRIWVDSVPGRGSTFHFTARFGIPTEPIDREPVIHPLRGVRVLVVEDNQTQTEALLEQLHSLAMQPTHAATGAEAIDAVRAAAHDDPPIQVALIDAGPAGEGLGVAVAERLHAIDPELRITLISAGVRAWDRDRLEAAGIRRTLTKPVTETELCATVGALLGIETGATDHAGAETGAEIRPLSILLAEDGKVNQLVAVQLLELRGHRVTVVETGRAAVDAALREDFDVILMDIQMPEMDGFEATAKIRAHESAAEHHTPIIAMTAHALRGDREHCLSLGMDEYLTKPIQADELYRVVENAASPDHAMTPAEPPVVAADDQILDLDFAVERVGGNRSVLDDLIELFFEEAPKLLADIQAAIERRDGPELRRAAHTLKGSATIFAAHRAADAALRLENAGKTLEFRLADEELAALRAEVDRLMEALRALSS